MPRNDAYHDTVKRALQKDGWLVTRDHLSILYGGLRIAIDLAAEKSVEGEQGQKQIAIEVKVFDAPPFVSNFEKAIGQYSLYRFMLRKGELDRELFLAITEKAHAEFFSLLAVEEYVAEHQIYLLIFNPETEEVIKWIK